MCSHGRNNRKMKEKVIREEGVANMTQHIRVVNAYSNRPYSILSANHLHSPMFLSTQHIPAWNKMIVLSRLNEKPAENNICISKKTREKYMYSSVFSSSKQIIKSNIKHTALVILTLIMGVVNSTMKDGTLSSDGQNE
jgi:hypothetical protein